MPPMAVLANALVFKGDIDEAPDLFSEVICLGPRSAQSHWGLANALIEKSASAGFFLRANLVSASVPERPMLARTDCSGS